MPRTLTDPGLEEPDRKLIRDVQGFGWAVVKVSTEGPLPQWAFTVGLWHNFRHPELLVFGLPLDTAHALLNDAGAMVREGERFSDGTITDALLVALPSAFRDVLPRWHGDFLGWMRWYYQPEDVPVLQFLWPDRDARFPWEPGFDAGLAHLQPLLYLADPHDARAAELVAANRR